MPARVGAVYGEYDDSGVKLARVNAVYAEYNDFAPYKTVRIGALYAEYLEPIVAATETPFVGWGIPRI